MVLATARFLLIASTWLAPGLLAITGSGQAAAQDSGDESSFAEPQEHFRVVEPAQLTDDQASAIYSQVAPEIVAGYRLSGDTSAADYRDWKRYNRVPYRSATHGERYVNNYANPKGAAYGRYEGFGKMPVGSVLAKDSFAVTSTGEVFTGPLFLMEKMRPGFHAASRDWRYTMIMPDGSLFGATLGPGTERVEFCITCHEAVGDDYDQMFFVPSEYRVEALQGQ